MCSVFSENLQSDELAASTNMDEIYCDEDDDVKNDDCDNTDEFTKDEVLREEFVKWAFENSITHMALKGIIQIINHRLEKSVLPKDPRTLLKTPRDVKISIIGNNQYYWHNGLQFCLENLFSKLSKPLTVSLNINMDGLPIYKSSKDELWPILFNIAEMQSVRPMVIGIYHGKSKASNLESYLLPMVDELKLAMEKGIFINGHKITVKLRCFICDSPARAFIKGNNQ